MYDGVLEIGVEVVVVGVVGVIGELDSNFARALLLY